MSGMEASIDAVARDLVAEHEAGQAFRPFAQARGIASLDDTMCRSVDELAVLFDQVAARPLAISSGHVHRPMSSMLGNIPAYVCGSICPPNPLMLAPDRAPAVTDRRSILVFDIEGTRVVAHHVSL